MYNRRRYIMNTRIDEDFSHPLVGTPFYVVYCSFMSKITDDLYAEGWTEQDTFKYMEEILIESLPRFKFPKFKIFDLDRSIITMMDEFDNVVSTGAFKEVLTIEEIEIIASIMFIGWLNRQVGTVQLTKMKIGSSDFKLTSQANHLDKLVKTVAFYQAEVKQLQSLYGRRKIAEDGRIVPNYDGLAKSAFNQQKQMYDVKDWWENSYWLKPADTNR